MNDTIGSGTSTSSMVRLAILCLLVFPITSNSQGLLLKNMYSLDDEFRGYCFDVAGRGDNARPDEALRAHTCKYGGANEDQLFLWVDDGSNHIAMPEYDRCLAVSSLESGAEIFIRSCANSELQAWDMRPTGKLSPQSRPDLCVTFDGERLMAGAPSWISPGFHYRNVALNLCEAAIQSRQTLRWATDVEQSGSLVNTRRRTLPTEIVEGIQAIGIQMNPDNMAKTQALLAELPYVYDTAEIELVADIAYGSHARHKLDVHTDKFRRSDAPMPVVMFVHGGGFLFGSKEGERNIPNYFASIGLIGVNVTYRLTPEAVWPNGAEDVGAAVNWVKENISEYGGDPEQIFVIGKSAGVEHVATYVFRPDLLAPDTASVAGAVFISGTYTPNVALPSRGELAYFGEDTSQWAGKGVLGNIQRSDIPVLITISEYDPPLYSQALAKMIHELALDHGRMPRVAQLPGHNHYSSNVSIGTTERAVSAEIVEFIRANIGQ